MYVYIGFLYSLVFLVYLFCLLGLNIEWFLKKVLWSMTFQLDVILIQPSKEVHFSLFCSVNLPEKQRLHLINEESISLFLQIFTASTEFFIRTRSLPRLVSIT